jgi:phosphoketolase
MRELTMKANTLTPESIHKMDAYRRAANYLSMGRRRVVTTPSPKALDLENAWKQ